MLSTAYLARTFSIGFRQLLSANGPVVSGYGVHLVRILESSPASTPPLEEQRDAVLRDRRAAKALELRKLAYAKLLERYTVEIRQGSTLPEVAK